MNKGIYTITNTKIKRVYVGSTKDYQARVSKHVRDLNHNRHGNWFLQRDWNYHGQKYFKFELIEVVDDDALLREREIFHIEQQTFPYNKAHNGNAIAYTDTPQYKRRLARERRQERRAQAQKAM